MDSPNSDNIYDVIAYREKTIPSKKLENFTFYHFDPTSLDKITPVLARDYYQIMIIVATKVDAVSSYNNVRLLNKDVQIILLDRWQFEVEDHRLEIMSSRDVLSSRFVDFLPNMPVIAQNVGIGSGEIMEIRVPVGSSYVYRHIASITQKRWQIAGIYRANSLILPRPTLMIRPNDVLLIVGDPGVLQSVYKSIKKELGQFPAPFGNSIYCLVDMRAMNDREINSLVNDALLLHSKINSMKLYIRIINPTFSHTYEKMKSYSNQHISVEIDFYEKNYNKVMRLDVEDKDIGLIVVSNKFFTNNISYLYKFGLPIFKIGAWGFSSLKEGVVLSSNSDDIEKESAVIFDVASQLDLEVKLYNFNPDNLSEQKALAEHFENLSKLFGKKVEVIHAQRNPLIKLRNRKDILQFVSFNTKIKDANIFSIFSTDMEKLYFKLSNSYQLFIPTQAE